MHAPHQHDLVTLYCIKFSDPNYTLNKMHAPHQHDLVTLYCIEFSDPNYTLNKMHAPQQHDPHCKINDS